jgi:hypothetical protein
MLVVDSVAARIRGKQELSALVTGCKENLRPSSAVDRTRGESKISFPLAGCG